MAASDDMKKTVAATGDIKKPVVKSTFSMMMDKSRMSKEAPALVFVVDISYEVLEKEDIPEIVEVEKEVSEAKKQEPASKKEKVPTATKAFSKANERARRR